MSSDKETKINLLLVGLSGSGKTDSCNTIFGKIEPSFNDDWYGAQTCSVGQKSVLGYDVTIIDTPGLYGSDDNEESCNPENFLQLIRRNFSMVAEGFTSIVIVIRLGRITEEIENSIRLIRQTFGDPVDFFTVIFTHKDQIVSGRKKKSVQNFVAEIPDNQLRRLLRDCNDRYIAFDNTQDPRSSTSLEQVKKFLEMVQGISCGGSRFYTEVMMNDAEMQLQERKAEEELEAISKVEERNKKIRLEVEEEIRGERDSEKYSMLRLVWQRGNIYLCNLFRKERKAEERNKESKLEGEEEIRGERDNDKPSMLRLVWQRGKMYLCNLYRKLQNPFVAVFLFCLVGGALWYAINVQNPLTTQLPGGKVFMVKKFAESNNVVGLANFTDVGLENFTDKAG